MPAAAGLICGPAINGGDGDVALRSGLIGAGVAALTVIVIDVALLAYDDAPPAKTARLGPARRDGRLVRYRWLPMVAPRADGGFDVGASGSL